MKFLTKLEKSKQFWSLFVICLVFFFLRLPSLIEPNWYGDEGIYQVIGQAMHSGRLLYSEIWDNKPPLLYVVYALINGDQQAIRFISLFVGFFSTIVFFCLSQKLFRKLSTSIISTSVFAIMIATPFLEGNIANAENFILLPIILAAFLIYSISKKKKFSTLLPGLLLGIAFLFKIVAIFDLAAFLIFFLVIHLPQKISWSFLRSTHKTLIPQAALLLVGFFAPFLITVLYFASQGALKDFLQAAFAGNVDYVGYGNKFLNIPQGLLMLKVALLSIASLFILLKRDTFSKTALFIIVWFLFSLFNAFFSQRPYTHYLLVLLPSFCLFVGLTFYIRTIYTRVIVIGLLMLTVFIVKENFWLSNLKKTISYYQNATLFVTGQRNLNSYYSFFDEKTPRDYEVASFIRTHTTASDKVFIWGNNAQIYALSHRLPPGKYVVAYHITQSERALEDTQKILSLTRPKYIIILSEATSVPFRIKEYSMRVVLEKAFVYERNF